MRLKRRKVHGNGVSLPVTTAAEAAKVARMKDEWRDKRGAVDNHTAAYVQAAVDYAVELTRSEYRPLANRNWKVIQKFGVRLIRIMVALVVVLSLLGALSYNTINEIQDGRRNAVLEKCHSGEHFDAKLKEIISKIPAGTKRVEAEANIKGTEALVATIVPLGHCDRALKEAGL